MSDTLVRQLASALEAGSLHKSATIAVGLSGGVDSMVLLHLLRRGLRLPPKRLSAIHVNHQISAHAASWATHCRRVCRDLGVPLKVVKVEVPRGNSTEAAARDARHAVFATSDAEIVALAHNRDDQAETLLLQLLRGAGPRGLAAMPAFRPGAPAYWRPLLDVPRSDIEAYARRNGLSWVEDDSNLDRGYLRNFLRHDVMPVIAARLPAASVVLARAARMQAEASDLLDALALHDLGTDQKSRSIPLGVLKHLPVHRARNVLRFFLRSNGVGMPDAARLEEVLRQAMTARSDARVCVSAGGVELRRFRDHLHIVRPLPVVAASFETDWSGRKPLRLPQLGGTLSLQRCEGDGIANRWLRGRALTLRIRQGGEKMHLIAGGPGRTVRNLLQEAFLPPWQRERLPLIYVGARLAAVPGVGTDERFLAPAGESGWQPVWQPD